LKPLAKRLTVGKSGVTPCKHDLLNQLLGREIGVLTRQNFINEYHVFDLTAGDGNPAQDGFTKSCSPGIALRHMNWAAENTAKPVAYYGIEKQPQTFALLEKNCGEWLTQNQWKLSGFTYKKNNALASFVNRDSKEISLSDFREHQGVFLYNDPNHIEDWCLTSSLMEAMPRFTTSLSTLGCNVGGLKRVEMEKRQMWYERVNQLVSSLVQTWHDACLFSVGGADQWAYLITAPIKWRESITKECLKAATKIKNRDANPQVYWFKESPEEFKLLQDYLFLTKAEFALSKRQEWKQSNFYLPRSTKQNLQAFVHEQKSLGINIDQSAVVNEAISKFISTNQKVIDND
jgi:hypothetical protein